MLQDDISLLYWLRFLVLILSSPSNGHSNNHFGFTSISSIMFNVDLDRFVSTQLEKETSVRRSSRQML